MENNKLKLIDLFAGAGGLTWGFANNGFDLVETVEFWSPAVKTYNRNFHKDVVPLDITDDKVRENIEKKWKNNADIIIGGFPCQGYSMAGKRNKDDARNQLYNFTIDVIKRTQPKLFVLENVKGILSFREKDNVLVIDKIQEKLKKLGYYTKFSLLDSSNFGVPQKRERVIFIGAKNKDKKKVDEIFNILTNYNSKTKTVYDAISDLEDSQEDVNFNHIFSKHSQEMVDKIKLTKPGESAMKGYSDAFKRLHYDKPSPTVKENHGGVHIHPKFNRVLTPRELARLQTFPDNFIFEGTKSQILKQIGNAVPCLLSDEIAKNVLKVFYDK